MYIWLKSRNNSCLTLDILRCGQNMNFYYSLMPKYTYWAENMRLNHTITISKLHIDQGRVFKIRCSSQSCLVAKKLKISCLTLKIDHNCLTVKLYFIDICIYFLPVVIFFTI